MKINTGYKFTLHRPIYTEENTRYAFSWLFIREFLFLTLKKLHRLPQSNNVEENNVDVFMHVFLQFSLR